MFSKKQLIIISLILAAVFHFLFYIHTYGPSISLLDGPLIYAFPIASSALMIFVYFTTRWRLSLSGSSSKWLYDLLISWVFICFSRSVTEMSSFDDMIPYLFSNYMGLSLFPVLFFIAGLNSNYFFTVNRWLSFYFFATAIISIPLITHFELQHFLLLLFFYIILTIPFRTWNGKFAIILITISVVATSLTNRAELMRISMSYAIILASFLAVYRKVSKRLLVFMVVIILMIPLVSLYLGFKGYSVFQMVSRDSIEYSQMDPYADTRTNLYFEVFQDLRLNNAFLFGKGLNTGYYSESFQMANREVVEVGFLQILLKTGIVGFILYISVIISSIIKALGKSNNQFIKSLGIYLATYIIMLFIENIIAYNLLNVVTWIIVGMCQSEGLRKLNDQGIKQLWLNRPASIEKV